MEIGIKIFMSTDKIRIVKKDQKSDLYIVKGNNSSKDTITKKPTFVFKKKDGSIIENSNNTEKKEKTGITLSKFPISLDYMESIFQDAKKQASNSSLGYNLLEMFKKGSLKSVNSAPKSRSTASANVGLIIGKKGSYLPPNLIAQSGRFDENSDEAIISKIRLDLNRLTESNVRDVKSAVIGKIKNGKILDSITDFIFTKILNEPTYSTLYFNVIEDHNQLKFNICSRITKLFDEIINDPSNQSSEDVCVSVACLIGFTFSKQIFEKVVAIRLCEKILEKLKCDNPHPFLFPVLEKFVRSCGIEIVKVIGDSFWDSIGTIKLNEKLTKRSIFFLDEILMMRVKNLEDQPHLPEPEVKSEEAIQSEVGSMYLQFCDNGDSYQLITSHNLLIPIALVHFTNFSDDLIQYSQFLVSLIRKANNSKSIVDSLCIGISKIKEYEIEAECKKVWIMVTYTILGLLFESVISYDNAIFIHDQIIKLPWDLENDLKWYIFYNHSFNGPKRFQWLKSKEIEYALNMPFHLKSASPFISQFSRLIAVAAVRSLFNSILPIENERALIPKIGKIFRLLSKNYRSVLEEEFEEEKKNAKFECSLEFDAFLH